MQGFFQSFCSFSDAFSSELSQFFKIKSRNLILEVVHIGKNKLNTESQKIIDPVLHLPIKSTNKFSLNSLLFPSDNGIFQVFDSLYLDTINSKIILFLIVL